MRPICFLLVCVSAAGLVSCHREPPPRDDAPASGSRDLPDEMPAAADVPAGRPNIVWILLDACRPLNLSCYGYERETSPNIDALARRGALFENHFTNGLWTVLSVPSYMTGRYFPVSCLGLAGADAPREVPPGERLLPDLLREQGYATFAVTAQPYISLRSRLYKAFDETKIVNPKDGFSKASFEELNAEILPWIARAQRPFFLYVHAMDTHFPHRVPPTYVKWAKPDYASPYVRDGQPTQRTDCRFSKEDQEQLRGLYDDSIRYADAGIGRILEALSEQNLLANTWVLIMADHGETIGEDGATWSHEVTVDEVMRPPLILAGPGIPEGKRVQALTESADIVPTLAELLRLPGPLVTEGKSLVPLLHGNTAPLHEYAFTRYVTQGYEGPTGYILRTPEYKYQYNDDTHEEFLWRVPDVVGKRSMCLAEHPGVAAEMRARMQRDLVPLWEAYAKLPKRYVDRIFTPAVIDACVRPRDAVIAGTGTVPAPAEVTDNKWTFREEGLWAAPWAEKAAPLEIRFEVPPGCYFVYVQVFGAHQLLEHRAGSIRIAVRGEPQPTVLQWMPEASKEQDSLFQEIGAYDLSGGVFDATVDSGDPEYWAAFGRFRFLMADKKDVETSSIAERKQREEQLRALGYAP